MKMSNETSEILGTDFPSPYKAAVDAVTGVTQKAQEAAAPCAIGQLIIEEAFAMLHASSLYSGLGEEGVTATFAASLASAAVLWRRHWIWKEPPTDYQLVWTHFNDKSETVIGADFCMVIIDAPSGGTRYRVIVVQAKRLDALEPERLNVKRKAFSKSRSKDAEEDWKAKADCNLRAALSSKSFENQLETPNWQLTRLIALMKKFDGDENRPSILYVAWPAMPTEARPKDNPILYEELDTVLKEIGNEKDSDGSLRQSFALDHGKIFRDYLLNNSDDQGISEGKLKEVVEKVKEGCTATIMINASGKELTNEAAAIFKQVPLPEYLPAKAQSPKKIPPLTIKIGR
ncbi:hypothetical protein [Duganella sp. Root336D2]|uniref:hypothetical protein n=1 Tax=Duganella sp. Root336D2 TaxID=1736518 RepID=UPI000701D307|nr:hypothetical protein [Duganella sp. Root336D2]KQV61417.1 hypothetical protein ASD07_00685 [Duganella sp. Root336D2]